jgi:hypothetical protein
MASKTNKGHEAWFDLPWAKIFNLAYARSRVMFQEDGSGEQIFAFPSDHSRMVLVDDVKTPVPFIRQGKHRILCIILETSFGTFQHLYCCNRVISQEERHHIQKRLVAIARAQGIGGDPAATGGAQPHRVPGSINYKPGRNLFVCRLVGNVVRHLDGGVGLNADEYLAALVVDEPSETLRPTDPELTQARQARKPIGQLDFSPSGQDWAWCIEKIDSHCNCGRPLDKAFQLDLAYQLEARAKERRGSDAKRYAKLTVVNLARKGFL